MFIFAIYASAPLSATPLAAFHIVAYNNEHRFSSTQSFTLVPAGDDESAMSRHFPDVPLGYDNPKAADMERWVQGT